MLFVKGLQHLTWHDWGCGVAREYPWSRWGHGLLCHRYWENIYIIKKFWFFNVWSLNFIGSFLSQNLALTKTRLLPWWEPTPLGRWAILWCKHKFKSCSKYHKWWNEGAADGFSLQMKAENSGHQGVWTVGEANEFNNQYFKVALKRISSDPNQGKANKKVKYQDLVDPSISWNHRAISTNIQWNAPGIAFMLNIDVALFIDIQVSPLH